MNFAEFLQSRHLQENFQTLSELFEFYGGNPGLDISFRQFQNVIAGKTPPSTDLLARILKVESSSNRRVLIQAYFKSHLDLKAHGKETIHYINKHLTDEMIEGSFDWEKRKHHHYTETQLDYLISHHEALKLHRRLILEEKVPTVSLSSSAKIIAQMIELELVERRGGFLVPSVNRYRLPKYGTASPRMVTRAHDFILKQIELFLSKEGAPHQEVSYAFQMVEKEIAQTALKQLKLLKEWIQSHVSSDTFDKSGNLVPLIFVGFCKELESHEILSQ